MLTKIIYKLRDIRAREMFLALENYVVGEVVDVGGGDFYHKVKDRLNFESWITVEPGIKDEKTEGPWRLVKADGYDLPFGDEHFDVALSIQVLEHVFQPILMLQEMVKVMKKGGKAIILVPQTSNLHMAPDHYYNFTRYWIKSACDHSGLEIVELKPFGGFFQVLHLDIFIFVLQAFKLKGSHHPDSKRPVLFYILLPIYLLWALINIPICMLFNLFDMEEEANNYLCVAVKK